MDHESWKLTGNLGWAEIDIFNIGVEISFWKSTIVLLLFLYTNLMYITFNVF